MPFVVNARTGRKVKQNWLPAFAASMAVGLGAVACSSSNTDPSSNVDGSPQTDASGEAPATSSGTDNLDPEPPNLTTLETGEEANFGEAPAVPEGPSDKAVEAALVGLIAPMVSGDIPDENLDTIRESSDPRFAWAVSDLLRFGQGTEAGDKTAELVQDLIGIDIDPNNPWGDSVDHLIAWDLPAHDDYFDFKRELFGTIDSRWSPLFEEGQEIDWRYVSWGGVFIDDRPLGNSEPCVRGCIPALDDPATTDADGGDWYPDEALVFGVEIDGEARAYPKNIMEIHEMVNDTLGARRLGIPYCTLCGSAQAYLTDELGDEFEEPVLRTSGLLTRSNKMMYELNTGSFVDTFLGDATSGSLAEAEVSFDQVTVVTSTWADWKKAHPETTIIAEDGGIGRTYPLDPLNGRDDEGPIFPIGDVDPRLPVQEPILGVTTEDGTPIAFHVSAAVDVLKSGGPVEADGISLELDGSGLRATDTRQDTVEGHQAFWFAWSQFQTDTKVWPFDFES